MARSKTSRQWLKEHFSDPYVIQSKAQGYRSRAVYKLLEIQEKDRMLQPGMVVVDLGAAPGGWSQVAADIIGTSGQVFALDILPMDPLPSVHFIQGDFSKSEVYDDLLRILDDRRVDIVMSDMAPNMSGVKVVDQPRVMYLAEMAFEFGKQTLKPGGGLILKVFQGEGFDELLRELRKAFEKVVVRKPPASRSRSPEIYFVGKGFRGGNIL